MASAAPPKARTTPTAAPEPSPVPEPATWTLRRGEHLWSVAEHVAAQALGRAPSEDEVAPYWVVLVDANRDRLVDPANPDLVHAGQDVVLPPYVAGRRR